MSDFGKFVGGLFIGGMVGGLLGVLLAPRSGSETRQKIADETNATYKKAELSLQEMQKQTEKAIEDLQKSGQDVLRKVADSLDPKAKKETSEECQCEDTKPEQEASEDKEEVS